MLEASSWRIRGGRSAKGTKFSVKRELVARPRRSSIWGPKCIRMYKQNKVESINEHYYRALGKFSCSEVLDQASDSTDPSQGLETEVRIHLVVVG